MAFDRGVCQAVFSVPGMGGIKGKRAGNQWPVMGQWAELDPGRRGDGVCVVWMEVIKWGGWEETRKIEAEGVGRTVGRGRGQSKVALQARRIRGDQGWDI